jgi:hypothetical protein
LRRARRSAASEIGFSESLGPALVFIPLIADFLSVRYQLAQMQKWRVEVAAPVVASAINSVSPGQESQVVDQ